MELLAVVAVLAVLTTIVAAAVTGVKSTSADGQVKGDGKAAQIAVDNYSNKSISTGQFPEVRPDAVVSTAGASNFHINADVAGVGSGDGKNLVLVGRDGKGETLADKVTPSGTTTGDAVFKRRLMEFTLSTNTWDDTGAVKTSTFVPDYLLKEPTSLVLKGDETKELGATNNTFEEYLWLLLVNSPGTDGEGRAVQVYRLVAADCSGAVSNDDALYGRTQP